MAVTTSTTGRPGRIRGRGGPARERYHRGEVLTAFAFLAPALAIIGVFVIYPIVAAARISFTSWNGFDPVMEFIGLGNYARLLQDGEFWNSLMVTVVYAVGVCILSVASGLTVALLLDAPMRGRGFYRGVYFLPAVTSSVAAAIVWRYLLDPAGYVNAVLGVLGISGPDWLQERWLALGALDTPDGLEEHRLQCRPVPRRLCRRCRRASSRPRRSMAHPPPAGCAHITIPLLAPMTFFVVVQALITAFQSFDLVYVLTGGGPRGGTEVLGIAHVPRGVPARRLRLRHLHRIRHPVPGARRLASCSGACPAPGGRPCDESAPASPTSGATPCSPRRAAFVVVPFLWMFTTSLQSRAETYTNTSLLPTSWHWENYLTRLGGRAVRAVLPQQPGHGGGDRRRAPGAGRARRLRVRAVAVPVQERDLLRPARGAVGAHLRDDHPRVLAGRILRLDRQLRALIVPRLADVFGIILLRQYFAGIPLELEDAARIDGCSRVGVFFRIIVPLAKPAFATLAIFSFLFAWNDFLLAAARDEHG